MATITKFENLEMWQIARSLSIQVFEITKSDLFAKDFRFKDQIRSAAGSVMDNIAEGFERSSRLEFIHFLGITKGSCGEVKSQLYRALDEKYISTDKQMELYERYENLSRGIAGFITYLNKSDFKGQKFKDRK